MKILFDQNAPRPLARFLTGHVVTRTAELGWQELVNGDLLEAAEAHGFELMVTADRNLRYQQNLTGRKLAIVVLPSGRWPLVKPHVPTIIRAVRDAGAGEYIEIVPRTEAG